MSKKIQVSVQFDSEHEYIVQHGTTDLALTIGSLLGLKCYGSILADGIYADIDVLGDLELKEYLIITAEICDAAHRLLVENKEAFMDEVFGPDFNGKHGVVSFEVDDYDEMVLLMHREIIENQW